MYNSVLSTRITCLYVSQPSSVVFACKTATFGPELQVSMGTRPHQSLCACKTTSLPSEILVSVSPRPHLPFCACKTACVAPEILVSMGVPALTCGFWMQNSDFLTRTTSLYGSQTSPVIFSMPNIAISIRIKRLYCLQPSPVVLCMQNSDFRTRITSLCGSKTPPVDFVCKTAPFGPE